VTTVGGFEWNDAKAVANLRNHGVSFEQATEACGDALALVINDELHADRYNVIGMGAGRVLFVVAVERGERTRIISARPATQPSAGPTKRGEDHGKHRKEVGAHEGGAVARGSRAREAPARTGFLAKPITLASLRKARNLTQAEVAIASGLKQGDVSRLEARASLDGVRVGTLRRYLAALGGGLELVADLSDRHRIPVVGVGAPKDR
jgi:uncharacterized DUF497 family protein